MSGAVGKLVNVKQSYTLIYQTSTLTKFVHTARQIVLFPYQNLCVIATYNNNFFRKNKMNRYSSVQSEFSNLQDTLIIVNLGSILASF